MVLITALSEPLYDRKVEEKSSGTVCIHFSGPLYILLRFKTEVNSLNKI
jgi:hypothetical protein